jgi:peptidoglycan/xylan/chitin deacetylase (PgdA/CDA1 family)
MQLFLTFDCEDFINAESTYALSRILELLDKYNLEAIFFITGHMCERLEHYPRILDFIEKHEIGYHSSAHSVHPTIFEYTDVENYDEARRISLERETSRINPLTGAIEGEGGLLALRDLFPGKRIVAFRAPGYSWSPPNLDALGELGIRFDFSTNLSTVPFCYRNITFYPYPTLGDGVLSSSCSPLGRLSAFDAVKLLEKSFTMGPRVLVVHPHNFVEVEDWDRSFFVGNPARLRVAKKKSCYATNIAFRSFEVFLRRTSYLAKVGVLKATPVLQRGIIKTHFSRKQVLRSYQRSCSWPKKYFGYTPKFLQKHFFDYFQMNDTGASLRPSTH